MQESKKYQFKYEYRQKYPVPAKFEYRMYGFTRTKKITVLSAAMTVHAGTNSTVPRYRAEFSPATVSAPDISILSDISC